MKHTWTQGRVKNLISSLESGVSVNGEGRFPSETEPAVLKVSAVTYGLFDQMAAKPINGKELKRAKCTPKAGQIIISRASGTPSHVGACAFIDRDYPDRFLPDKLWQTVPNPDAEVDLKWLFYYLTSPRTKAKIISFATGTNIKNITQSELLAIPVSIPPYPEQTAIADLLSTWDTAIENTEQLIAAKLEQRKGLMQKLISEQCNNWPHFKSEEIFGSISEKNYPEEELLSVTQDQGVIPRKMLEGRVMSPASGTSGYKLIDVGDFAISLRSFQGGIEYSKYRGIISPAYTVLRRKIELHDDFFRHFFKSHLFVEKYLRIAVIGIRDGKQVSIPDFMTVKIPCPTIEEQEEISSVINLADKEISLLQQQLYAFKEQKKGLMQQLLTGKVRVRTDSEVTDAI